MTDRSSLLQALTRNELLEFVDLLAIELADRRTKAPLVEALIELDAEDFAEVLSTLPRARLKDLCRGLDLDDSGKDKASIVERLVAHTATPAPKPEPKPKPKPASAPVKSKPAATPPLRPGEQNREPRHAGSIG